MFGGHRSVALFPLLMQYPSLFWSYFVGTHCRLRQINISMTPRLALRALRYLASTHTHTPPNALALPLGAFTARLASTQPKASDSPAPSSNPSPSSSVASPSPSSSASRQTPTDASASASTQAGPSKTADRLAIPPLSRPPGVPNPPTAIPKSWSQRKDELLDEERHKAKRKAL